MRNGKTDPWITASCGFLVLVLLLAGEGFLLTESVNFQPAGSQVHPSEAVMKALFHAGP
jgi:hypothetical protein